MTDNIFTQLENAKDRSEMQRILIRRSQELADQQGFKTPEEQDAFRHTYSMGVLTKYYGNTWMPLSGGAWNEATIIGRNARREISGKHDPWMKTAEESLKDLKNNNGGIEIGKTAINEDDIIQKTTQRIKAGEAVIQPTIIEDFFNNIGEFFDNLFDFQLKDTGRWRTGLPIPSNISAGEWDHVDIGVGSGIDPARLMQAFGGRKKSRAMGQALIPAAAALARELHKSRRMSLEDDMIAIFTGREKGQILDGWKHGGTPPFINDGREPAFNDFLSGALERMVGAAFSRQRSRSSTMETTRSMQAQAGYRLSRSQQSAALAQQVQQGARNL